MPTPPNPYANLDGLDLPALLDFAWELRLEKKALEVDLDRVNRALMDRLGDERAFATDALSAAVVQRPARLKVTAAAAIAAEFCTLQPDRKLIDSHFSETGEIIDGTELAPPTAYVMVRQAKQG